VLFEEVIYPCESGGGGGGGEKLVVRAEASIVGGLGVWLGLCHFILVSEKKWDEVRGKNKLTRYTPSTFCDKRRRLSSRSG
jgi:hypothetical protein